MAELNVQAKIALIVDAAREMKAEDIVVLDVKELTSFTDHFLLCSGRSDRQVRAIADSVVRALKEAGDAPLGVEGLDEGTWVLLDCNDIVAHVFAPEAREEYALERLWHDAPRHEFGERDSSEDRKEKMAR